MTVAVLDARLAELRASIEREMRILAVSPIGAVLVGIGLAYAIGQAVGAQAPGG